MVDLGTLEIGLRLDKGAVERDIKDIRKELETLYDLTTTNNIAIKPKVDHEPLTALNKHLDKKVRHLKQVRNEFKNPIKVSYETDEGKRQGRSGSSQPQRSGEDNNWESKLGNVFQQVLDKSISDGVKELLKGLPGPIKSSISNPFIGFIQGFTGGLGDRAVNIALNAIQKELRKSQAPKVRTGYPAPERPILSGYDDRGTSRSSKPVPDPWDENDPLPIVEVIGKGEDSAQANKKRTVELTQVKEDKSKLQMASGYSARGNSSITNISTQNSFKVLATEIRKLNSRIVPAPVQSLTQGLQGGEIGSLTSAIVSLQASIDSLNDRFSQFNGGEITGGLSVLPPKGEIISLDDLIDPTPVQMTATVIGNVTGGLTRLGRGVQTVGGFAGKTIAPLYRMAAAIEDIVLTTLPYGHLGKKVIQGTAPLALGAGAMHLLPGGVGSGMVHMAQSGLSPMTGMGASAISGMVADAVAGLPLGIGTAISSNVAGLLAGGAEMIANVGGAGLAMGFLGKGVQNLAKLPFKQLDSKMFAPNPILISPAGSPIEQIQGKNNKSLSGSSPTQPSLPSAGGLVQGMMNVKQLNAGEIKSNQLALPSKSGGVNYDVTGLDNLKSAQDLTDYLSPQNKLKNQQGKNVQLFELDGLRRLAQALAGINGDSIKSNLSRKETVSYITKQDLSQVMGLLAQNPSRYYNPKAGITSQVVNPVAETRKSPQAVKEQITNIKQGAERVSGNFRSATNIDELKGALQSYKAFSTSLQQMRLNLLPTRELNGIQTSLKSSIEKGIVEVARGVDQGLGKSISLDMAIGVLQKEAPELANVVKKVLGIASPSKVFFKLGTYAIQGLAKGFRDPSAIKEIQGMITSVNDLIASAMPHIGRSMADGIQKGVGNSFKNLGSEIGLSITSSVKKVLGIQSPSRVFIEIGRNIIKGLQIGFTGDFGTFNNVAKRSFLNYVLQAKKYSEVGGIGDIGSSDVGKERKQQIKDPYKVQRGGDLVSIPKNTLKDDQDQVTKTWDELNAKRTKFKVSKLNVGNNLLEIMKDNLSLEFANTQDLQTKARAMGRNLTRAVKAGLSDDKELGARIKVLKEELSNIAIAERNLASSKSRLNKAESRQSINKKEQQSIQNELTSLRSAPQSALVQQQIAKQEQELLRLSNEATKLQQVINKEKANSSLLEQYITRDRKEAAAKTKELNKLLRTEVANNPKVYQKLEDQRAQARVYQTVRSAKEFIPGNREQKEQGINNVAGFGVSAMTAFAPQGWLMGLLPAFMKLTPTIVGLTGAFRMLRPYLQEVSDNIQRLGSFQNRFNTISVDPVVKGKESEYVKGVANKTGLSREVLSQEYTRLYTAARGTKLQGAETKQLFEGISASVKALNLTTYESELVFGAYNQMLSKGKISMEELRQQLGEKFPPAMSVFSKALGVSTAELDSLVSKGAVLSDDVLSKVGKQLKMEYEPMIGFGGETFNSSLSRFQNSLLEIQLRLVETFDDLFIALNVVMTKGLNWLASSFDVFKNVVLTGVIGVSAVLAVGATQMLKTPVLANAVSTFSSILTSSFSRLGTAVLPFAFGIGTDFVSMMFGNKQPMFDMFAGLENMKKSGDELFTSMADSGHPLMEVLDVLKNGILQVGGALKWLQEKGKGPMQLIALVLLFEQIAVLGKMYVFPAIQSVAVSVTNLSRSMMAGLSSGKNWKAMLREAIPTASATTLAFLGLEAALGVLMLAFARGDFANPLRETFKELNSSVRDLWKAFEPLTKFKINPEVITPEFDNLPAKGIETNLKVILGLETGEKSVKSDEIISQAKSNPNEGKYVLNVPALGTGFLAKAVVAAFGGPTAKANFYDALGIGGGKISDEQKKTLTDRGLDEFIPSNERETVAIRMLVNNLNDLDDLKTDINNLISQRGLDKDNIAETIKTIEARSNQVVQEQALPILRDSGLSQQKQDELAQIKTIDELDSKMQSLGARRSELSVIGSPEALEEIRAIDMELRAIEGIRKNVVIEVSTQVEVLDQAQAKYKEAIATIEKMDVDIDIKNQMKAEIEGVSKEIDRIKDSLGQAGFYDKLKPLEDVFKRVTLAIRKMNYEYDKFAIQNIEQTAQDRVGLYNSRVAPEMLPIQLGKVNLDSDTARLTELTKKLAEYQEQFKVLSAIAIPAEGDPRSQERDNLKQEIRQMRQEKAELLTSVAQQEYDAVQNQIRRLTSLRDFDRRKVDLGLQIEGAIRQQKIDLRGLLRQQDDFVNQTRLSARNLVQSFGDLNIQINRKAIELNNQIKQAVRDTERVTLGNDLNRLMKPGDGLFTEFTNLFTRAMDIYDNFQTEEENINLQVLDVEQQKIQIARQIRDLQEQAHQLEIQRLRQLEDLATAQETYAINQKQTWMNIARSVEDMYTQAQIMGVKFENIADYLGDIAGHYLKINDIVAKVAKDMQDSANNIPSVSSSNGQVTGNVFTPIAGLNMNSNHQWGANRRYGKHWKVDYADVKAGDAVVAPIDGILKATAIENGESMLTLRQGNVEIILGHIREAIVDVGKEVQVSAGQKIGVVGGESGSFGSTGRHLDYGVKHNGNWIHPNLFHKNPEKYLPSTYFTSNQTIPSNLSNTQNNFGQRVSRDQLELESRTGNTQPQQVNKGGVRTKGNLTFDDGPNPQITPKVLDQLKATGQKATFYLVGAMVDAYPELVQRAYKEGHTLGVHSYTHRDLTKLSSSDVEKELRFTRDAINNAVRKVDPNYKGVQQFRAPYGATNSSVNSTARNLGLTSSQGWDVDTNDWRKSTTAGEIRQDIQGATQGQVILLHDGNALMDINKNAKLQLLIKQKFSDFNPVRPDHREASPSRQRTLDSLRSSNLNFKVPQEVAIEVAFTGVSDIPLLQQLGIPDTLNIPVSLDVDSRQLMAQRLPERTNYRDEEWNNIQTPRDAIIWVSKKLQVNARDLAALASFESGSGNFSTSNMGGDGNNYMGWLQLSPDAREKLGVQQGVSQRDYALAVVRYFKEFRAKPLRAGASLQEIYNEINPGFGNVRPRLERDGHFQRADKLLGGNYAETPSYNNTPISPLRTESIEAMRKLEQLAQLPTMNVNPLTESDKIRVAQGNVPNLDIYSLKEKQGQNIQQEERLSQERRSLNLANLIQGYTQLINQIANLNYQFKDKAIQLERAINADNLAVLDFSLMAKGFNTLEESLTVGRLKAIQEFDSKVNQIVDSSRALEKEIIVTKENLEELSKIGIRKVLEQWNIKPPSDLEGNQLIEFALTNNRNSLSEEQVKILLGYQQSLVDSQNLLDVANKKITQNNKLLDDLDNNKETFLNTQETRINTEGMKKLNSSISSLSNFVGSSLTQKGTTGEQKSIGLAFTRIAKMASLNNEVADLTNPINMAELVANSGGSLTTDDILKLVNQAQQQAQRTIMFETSGYNEMKTEFGQLADMMNSIGGQLNQRGDLLRGNWLTSNAQAIQTKIQVSDMKLGLQELFKSGRLGDVNTDETKARFNSLNASIEQFEKNSLAKLAVDNNFVVSGLVDPMKTAITGLATIMIDKSKSFWEKVNDIMTNFLTSIANHFANNFSTAVTTWITEKLAQWMNWGVNTGTESLDIATATALNSAGIKLDASTFMLDEASRSQTLAAWELAQAAAKLNASIGVQQKTGGGGIGSSILQSAIGAFMQPIASLGFGAIVPDTGALSNTLGTSVPSVADYTTGFTAGGSYSIAEGVNIKGWGNYAKGGLVDIENFAKGGLVEQAQKALAKERMLGGGKAILSALTVGEYVVPKNPNRKDIANLYANVPMARNMQIENYAKGGMVGKASSMGSMVANNSRIETKDNSFVSNIYVNANDAGSFRKTRYQLEMEENARLARSARRF